MILRGLYCVWIIGCVACLIVFMSVFFSSQKTVLKAYSTPPRHLAICRASKLFLIEILTPPRHLVDRSIMFLSPQQLLNSCSIDRGLLNSFSTPLILLHELSFTCFASFFYLCVHSILFLFFLQFYGSLFSSFPLCQFSVYLLSKRGRNLRIECLSLGGIIDLGGELHVKREESY